jgi:hypothetical protein
MFEQSPVPLRPPCRAGFDANTIVDWITTLRSPDRVADDPARIAQIAALERLKSAAAAAQAVLTADFAASQRAAQRAAGMSADRLGRGIAAQVALARRDSPHRANRHLGLASALVGEMPATMAALRDGEISEWRATIVARETACLTREDRAAADAEMAARPGGLGALGDRQVEAEARKIAYRLDPRAYMNRIRGAAADRRVTLRPAPDTMARLSGFLPVAQGVAAYAALSRHADTLRAGGDPRGRGQIMADTLVERLTGQAGADAVPVEIHLVMTDAALLGPHPAGDNPGAGESGDAGPAGPGDQPTDTEPADSEELAVDEPAHLLGFGPIPAAAARDLVRDTEAQVWRRRLYTRPGTGELIAMDSKRRCFPKPLRRFLVVRDQFCRTPWCGAPIRHDDHVVPAEHGGPTSAANGQGLCEACNLTKQAPGWAAQPAPGGAGEAVSVTTPTGPSYPSQPPLPPGAPVTRPHPGNPPPASRHPDGRHPTGRRETLRRQLDQGDSVLEQHLRGRFDAA